MMMKKEMMGGGQDEREESRFSSLGKLFVLKEKKRKEKNISPADWVLFQPQVDKHTNQPISSTK